MEKLILVIHVLAALGVIGLVLLQHGKGADMGASFGSGTSGSLFGVSGSANFMSKATAVFVIIFFSTSLTLAYMSSHRTSGSVIKANAASVVSGAKVAPAAATPKPPAGSEDIPK